MKSRKRFRLLVKAATDMKIDLYGGKCKIGWFWYVVMSIMAYPTVRKLIIYAYDILRWMSS